MAHTGVWILGGTYMVELASHFLLSLLWMTLVLLSFRVLLDLGFGGGKTYNER